MNNSILVIVQFHIGHLYEMQNKCQSAQETYEAVIQNPDITNDVKSNVYKQLGMYFEICIIIFKCNSSNTSKQV